MKKYKQLNLEERVTIKVLLQQEKFKRAIARYLGRSPSLICAELEQEAFIFLRHSLKLFQELQFLILALLLLPLLHLLILLLFQALFCKNLISCF